MAPGPGHGRGDQVPGRDPGAEGDRLGHRQGTGAGGHVQIRATSPDDPEGGTLLAEGEFTQGTTTFNFQKPTETSTVVLLVTRLPKSSDGENKLTITEITLR